MKIYKIKYLLLIMVAIYSSLNVESQQLSLSNYRWTPIAAAGDVTGRHENAFIEYKGKFYLLGGRGTNPVNIFDPKTNSWEVKAKSPMEIHHFQGVVYGDAIYMIGAMTGGYPTETPLENIWLYYPETDTWKKGPEIPETRRRGGAGAVVFNDKIYLIGGIKFGHTSGTTNYFDSYDLITGKWEILTDAPHIRDHFPASLVNNKLYCIGGRNTSVHHTDNFGAFFDATIPEVDYYDFIEKKWYILKENLPVPTAAGGIVNIGENLIYMGGEGSQALAYNQTQCLNTETGKWEQLAPLYTGRHGSSAILFENKIFIAAGSPNKGGGNLGSIEVFSTYSQNPFITHMYTADPSARVFNNTLYVYPSHDEDTATWFSMKDWHVFSTTDMKNWTDHGVALSLDDLSWAKSMAWAPDCAFRNGKYYFYFPVDQSKIGVTVGDKPYGPFKDPLDTALIHTNSNGVVCNRDFIDPCVFIDDDGQAYLYMGQLVVNAIKLNEDMVSYDGEVHLLEGTDDFFEAIWMHKYKGKYYLSYVGKSGEIKYCMSDKPLGPFEYKGVILEKMNSGTNHHSIVEFNGQWYMFYHNSDQYFRNHPELEPKFGWGHEGSHHPFRRSICFDKMVYNLDGTIKQVIPTK